MTTEMTDKPVTTTEVQAGGWWALPKETQEAILAAMPQQDEWSFVATRISDTAWSIDVPEAGTYGELLVGGTNEALDDHFLNMQMAPAVNGDTLKVIVSPKPIWETTTTFTKIKDDPLWEGSAFYRDDFLDIQCWLCPFTSVLWGESPERIYIRLEDNV